MGVAFPTLVGATVRTIEGVLAKSRDALVRVDCNSTTNIQDLIAQLDPAQTLRFGLTAPFRDAPLSRRKGISRDPQVITGWRNEPVVKRRSSPIVLLGKASGREESGLRRVPFVVDEPQILDTFNRLGGAWLEAHVISKSPLAFFRALVALAREYRIDAALLDNYCSLVFRDPANAHIRPQKELWIVGLIPDSRAMDSQVPGPRLGLNYSIVDLLLSVPDGKADERRVTRLKEEANQGNDVAVTALKFGKNRNFRLLKQIELDQLLQLTTPQRGGRGTKTEQRQVVDLFEALDKPSEGLVDALDELGRTWELDAQDFKGRIDSAEYEVRCAFSAVTDESSLFILPNEGLLQQVLWRIRSTESLIEGAKAFTAERLMVAAKEADLLSGRSAFEESISQLLERRQQLSQVERWLDVSLELLILKPDILDASERYLEAWRAAVDMVVREADVAQVSALWDLLIYLDADWQIDEQNGFSDVVSVELIPVHPYVLLPKVYLARYVRDRIGTENLGRQVLWAQDRTVPAYPAIWNRNATLIHKSGRERPIFRARGTQRRPEVSAAGSIIDVVKSYIGLHPYAKTGLSLLFVDPPKGSGIPSALRSIEQQGIVERINLQVVNTSAESSEWTSLTDRLEYLGRIRGIAELGKIGIQAHVGFIFYPSQPGNVGSHSGEYRPSRGLQNQLTVSITAPPLTLSVANPDERIPFVSIQPRDANELVLLMMKLGRASNREDQFFQVTPMLGRASALDLVSASETCDWLVVATPSPMGLIPPRVFSEEAVIYLGREDLGAYGLFVYSDDLFVVRRAIQEKLLDAPLQPTHRELESQIQQLALAVPNGVLRLGRSENAVNAQIGLMAAAHFAQGTVQLQSGYLAISLSVDSLEWTKHWLEGTRCDLLFVFIAASESATPRVRIVAVESKTKAGDVPLDARLTAGPFREAVDQVVATLDALEEIINPEAAASLLSDVKLAVFFEHLVSEVLAQIHPIRVGDVEKLQVLKTLTSLSRRELVYQRDLLLEGLAVVTLPNSTVPTREVVIEAGERVSWKVRLVRCGVPTLRELFEASRLGNLADVAWGKEWGGNLSSIDVAATSMEVEEERPITATQEVSSLTRDLAIQLEAALRLRGFKISDIDIGLSKQGPTLVSIPVQLAAGESLRPIEGAVEDIARELGTPSLSVENDAERPYYIRFLVPRVERVFPEIPPGSPFLLSPSGEQYLGLFLGAKIDGEPFISYVSDWPHLLVAGTTGSGKTTFMKSILTQLGRLNAGDFSVAIIDGKGEYDYIGLLDRSHFVQRFPDVLLGHENAPIVLEWLVEEEIPRRRGVLRTYFEKNPKAPRSPKQAYGAARQSNARFPLSPLLIVVDEFAEIMLAAGASSRTFENLVQRTVQTGRSALVHLLLATQRPDANVLRGAIKANLPSRVALSLPTHHDSMTVLGSGGAEILLGQGDLIFQSSTSDRIRLQGYRV